MQLCAKCGYALTPFEKRCPRCGHVYGDPLPEPELPIVRNEPPAPPPPPYYPPAETFAQPPIDHELAELYRQYKQAHGNVWLSFWIGLFCLWPLWIYSYTENTKLQAIRARIAARGLNPDTWVKQMSAGTGMSSSLILLIITGIVIASAVVIGLLVDMAQNR